MTHLIEKQIIDLRLTRTEDAFEMQQKVSTFCAAQLLPALDDLFSRLAPTDKHIRLDELVIDLGYMSEKDLLSAHFLEDILAQIERTIDSQIRDNPEQVVVRHKETNVFVQWLYFLENGRLPWYVHGAPPNFEADVPPILARSEAAIVQLQGLLTQQPTALERLIRQHNTAFLALVAGIYTGRVQTELAEVATALARVAGQNRVHDFWQSIFERVIVRRGKWTALDLIVRTLGDLLHVFAQREKEHAKRKNTDLFRDYTEGGIGDDLLPIDFPFLAETEAFLTKEQTQNAWVLRQQTIAEAVRERTLLAKKTADGLTAAEQNFATKEAEKALAENAATEQARAAKEAALATENAKKGEVANPTSDKLKALAAENAEKSGATHPTTDKSTALATGNAEKSEATNPITDKSTALATKNAEKSEVTNPTTDKSTALATENAEKSEATNPITDKSTALATENAEKSEATNPITDTTTATVSENKEQNEVTNTTVEAAETLAAKEKTAETMGVKRQDTAKETSAEATKKEQNTDLSQDYREGVAAAETAALLSKTAQTDDANAVANDANAALSKKKAQQRADMLNWDNAPTQARTTGEIPKEMYVSNAGIVLLHPFLGRLFENLGLTKNGAFKSEAMRHKALGVLHYLATGETVVLEYNLMLPKLLCHMPLNLPVHGHFVVSKKAKKECEDLLKIAIAHWAALGNTSAAGLREAFLQRNGKLINRPSGWLLQVERTTIDVLIDRLPWGLGIVKLPWMRDFMTVEW